MAQRADLPHRPLTLPVTQKGQVTIPAPFRHLLGIDAPGEVSAFLGDDGDVHLRAVEPADDLRSKYRPVAGREHASFEQMADDAMQDLADETISEMRQP